MVFFRRKTFDLDVQLVFRKIKRAENFQHENSFKILYVDGALAFGARFRKSSKSSVIKEVVVERLLATKIKFNFKFTLAILSAGHILSLFQFKSIIYTVIGLK